MSHNVRLRPIPAVRAAGRSGHEATGLNGQTWRRSESLGRALRQGRSLRTPPGTLILNADDLGMSDEVNASTISALDLGLASSATVMANMPGFEGAVHLIAKHDLACRIGVHVNLTEGFPLTDGLKRCSRLCARDGSLKSTPTTLMRLSPAEQRAAYQEIAAQLDRCINHGVRPTHINSHHHVHTAWALRPIIARLAAEFTIPYVRLAHNVRGSVSMLHWCYSLAYNTFLYSQGLAGVANFAGLSAIAGKPTNGLASLELAVHPSRHQNGHLTDFPTGSPLRSLVDVVTIDRKVVSYSDLANLPLD